MARRNEWIFGPEAPYEQEGDVANAAFPCGHTLAADGDTFNVYCGAADTSIALAAGSVRELLDWLDKPIEVASATCLESLPQPPCSEPMASREPGGCPRSLLRAVGMQQAARGCRRPISAHVVRGPCGTRIATYIV